MASAFTLTDLSLHYSEKHLLKHVTLTVSEGDKIGIIGINGTGKSSLLRVLAGQQVPDQGAVSLDPNVQVCFLPQNPAMVEGATVLEQVFHDFSPDTRALLEYEAKAMLTRLGITDFTQPVDTLSGGQRKRVALAAVLLHPADVLILDEPTNHLDSDMVLWLEDHLRKFTGGLIMVTHDRYFLERVCNRITTAASATTRPTIPSTWNRKPSRRRWTRPPSGSASPSSGWSTSGSCGGPRPGGPRTRTASPAMNS